MVSFPHMDVDKFGGGADRIGSGGADRIGSGGAGWKCRGCVPRHPLKSGYSVSVCERGGKSFALLMKSASDIP